MTFLHIPGALKRKFRETHCVKISNTLWLEEILCWTKALKVLNKQENIQLEATCGLLGIKVQLRYTNRLNIKCWISFVNSC